MYREKIQTSALTDYNLIVLLGFSWKRPIRDVDKTPMMVYITLLLTSRSRTGEKAILLRRLKSKKG